MSPLFALLRFFVSISYFKWITSSKALLWYAPPSKAFPPVRNIKRPTAKHKANLQWSICGNSNPNLIRFWLIRLRAFIQAQVWINPIPSMADFLSSTHWKFSNAFRPLERSTVPSIVGIIMRQCIAIWLGHAYADYIYSYANALSCA